MVFFNSRQVQESEIQFIFLGGRGNACGKVNVLEKVDRNGIDTDIFPLNQFVSILVTVSNGYQYVYIAMMETHHFPIEAVEMVILKIISIWILTKIPF